MNKLIDFKILFFLLTLALSPHSHALSIADIENSVVKIYVTKANPDYSAPWRLSTPQQGTGSGAIISGQRILTNAHVIENAKYVQVQKNRESNKYAAEVTFISHEADLAILKVKDKKFFAGTQPLSLGQLPKSYQEVAVFGYPMGGKALSITKGVLSRIEHSYYDQSGKELLAGQIDAAINPGNSGGPVIAQQKMVGIVMQRESLEGAESINYFIPPPIIAHVLKDSEDSNYDGFPTLDFTVQDLKNPAAKAYYGLTGKQSGILVTRVFPNTEVSKFLKKNDVLMKIDQYQIAGDGSVDFSPTLRANFIHAIDLHHVGDKIQLTYARAGKIYTRSFIAQRHPKWHQLIPPSKYESLPRYYIYGGIVFVPVTDDLLMQTGWISGLPSERYQMETRRELVAAFQILSADVNFGYEDFEGRAIYSVNGESIVDFAHFAKMLAENKAKYVVFEDKNGEQMVINHAQALKSEADIFTNYDIPARYSKGLFKTEKAGK